MRLHEQVKQLKEEKQILKEGMIELLQYCNSSKFSEDIMINKNDIILRLKEIDNTLFLEEVKRN